MLCSIKKPCLLFHLIPYFFISFFSSSFAQNVDMRIVEKYSGSKIFEQIDKKCCAQFGGSWREKNLNFRGVCHKITPDFYNTFIDNIFSCIRKGLVEYEAARGSASEPILSSESKSKMKVRAGAKVKTKMKKKRNQNPSISDGG